MMRLADFSGNRRLIRILSGARLPQVLLLAGPEGVGKRSLAISLAALANCRGPVDGDLCGHCPSCLKAAAGNHPDIRLIQPETSLIRVADIRDTLREAQYRPFEGRLRVFIFDPADRMSEAAANASLKTFEEPPETTRFILVTPFPQLVLPTVRSRSMIFPFQPLKREEIGEILRRQGVDDEGLELRAAISEGSVGRALNLNLEEVVGVRDIMLEILESWLESGAFRRIYRRCEEAPLKSEIRKRERTRFLLDQLQLLGEDLYYIFMDTPERIVNLDRRSRLEGLAKSTSVDWIRLFLYHVQRARREVDQNVNPLMCFETLWLECPPHR